jgi:hypothetical protein
VHDPPYCLQLSHPASTASRTLPPRGAKAEESRNFALFNAPNQGNKMRFEKYDHDENDNGPGERTESLHYCCNIIDPIASG